jgi:CDP-glucose 4,6-dehydratase
VVSHEYPIGDWAPDRLVPDVIRALARGEVASIRNPHAVRPWQHVLDPLAGYLLLAQRLWEEGTAYAEGWNFGPSEDDARPVSWIVDYLTKCWGEGSSWRLDGAKHLHEAGFLKLDCSKARSRLGWRPRWRLEQALDSIVTWHRAREAGQDMREVSLQQLGEYLRTSDG